MTDEVTTSNGRGRNITDLSVLLCDQDAEYRQLLRAMLAQSEHVNFRVREAANSRQIESELADKIPDVLVLALNLNDKSAMEWLADMQVGNVAPAIVLAANGNEQIAVETMKLGAYDYIPKAFLAFDQLSKSLINAREKWSLLKETQRLQAELEKMAHYDNLTDLLSRGALMDQIEAEIQRTRRYKRDLSLLMVDIDLFKKVNDTYGHIVGDAVLRKLAKVLMKGTRGSDFAGRYGGEEFLILLPETPLDKALILAEKLRANVAKMVVPYDDGELRDITISLGAAEYDEDTCVEDFINRSDKWLYHAKQNGRNQVQPKLGSEGE